MKKKLNFNELMLDSLISTGMKITVTKTRIHKGHHAPAGKIFFVGAAKKGKRKFTVSVKMDIEGLTPDKEKQIREELKEHVKSIFKREI
ncbi:hypothetical protein BCY91_14060 [Pelobium manganitolerans]|uniref:Uncharacterized protein n=1 Tax=Pelobium manganitolerans TaxID=1842495 RepID=A0A419S9X0_9SPHI|nr:hypothetical protein [Pelobium manganitolerans]RKD18997.1 hypothetical protein BCY91_14060 [Pelobium manganitolerans]